MMTRYSKRGVVFAGILATLAGGLCAQPAHAQFSKMSENDEIKAGRQTAQQAFKEVGPPVSQNDPRQVRVSRIGALFARQASRKTIPYSYTVLQNDKVLNAFAAPGGPIFVTTKLVETTANDAELAYVLGHETGHIEHKHIVKAVQKQQTVGLIAGIAGAILGGGKGGNIINAATGVTYTLWQKGYSRDQERDADDYGVHAMAKLGFDPQGAVTMLGKLGDGPDGVQKYLSDHPTSSSRQEAMRNDIQKNNLENIARQSGGPYTSLNQLRATDRAPSFSSNGYTSTPAPSYYASNSNPNSGGNSNQGKNNGNGYNPSIRLRTVESGRYRLVLAPVNDLAQWAGGQVQNRDDETIVRRGSYSGRFRQDSNHATVNGRDVQTSSPARSIDGQLYVSVGTLASALGGEATYDEAQNAIRIDFGDGLSDEFAL